MAWHRLVSCVVLLMALGSYCEDVEKEDTSRKVLVVSLDGFGHEYLAKYSGNLKHLGQLYSHGSYPKWFRNQFVTKTFPNHFSVATGLYEEVHGVVANTIYDPELNKTLQIMDDGFFTQNPAVTPIWTLNELHGGLSGCIMWPGCSATYQGQNLTYYKPYEQKAVLKDSIDQAIQWMTDGLSPANLVFIYHEQPDAIGHQFGPDSEEMEEELKKIDDSIGYLYNILEIYDLLAKTDVIILSDHGMMSVPLDNLIDLDKIVNPSLYRMSGTSPVLLIWPLKDELDVYKRLSEAAQDNHYKVYLKNDVPSDWHYSNNKRISHIVLLANNGYVFQDWKPQIDKIKAQGLNHPIGDHGYPVNIPSMHPIFVAAGPSFRRNFMSQSFSNLDVYPLLCHLLALPPNPHNGTLEIVSTILAYPVTADLIKPLFIALGCLMMLIGLIGILACALARKEQHMVSADSLITGYVHRKTMRSGSSKLNEEDASEEELLLENEVVTL